ncbi:MAG: DNA polymerase III subunit delta' [Syntrophomonadaceae bacterium]|nr:DNA polymerase III subunit delta' [Syntrophomonadaceae bacterium]
MEYTLEATAPGQEQAWRQVQQAVSGGIPSHAYLLVGPPALGKARVAVEFARLLLEIDQAAWQEWVARGYHPDLFWVQREKSRIGIDDVRRVEEWLAYRPHSARRRVVVMREAHLLSLEAANALLKTLEEPPEDAVVILVSDAEDLLPTLRSRCQEVRFRPLPQAEIVAILRRQGFDGEQAVRAAALARGSLVRARQLLEGGDLQDTMGEAYQYLHRLAAGDRLAVWEKAEDLERDAVARQRFLDCLEVAVRDVMVTRYGGDMAAVLFQGNGSPGELARGGTSGAGRALETVAEARTRLTTAASPLLVLVAMGIGIQRALREE